MGTGSPRMTAVLAAYRAAAQIRIGGYRSLRKDSKENKWN